MDDKSKAAAERAELLESLTPEQRSKYRERRNKQGEFMIGFDMFNFIREDADDEESLKDGCLLLLAVADYAESGEEPTFVDAATGEINKSLRRTFKSFIKPKLDTSFDNYCLSCLKNEIKGKRGGDEAKIRRRIIDRIGEYFPNTQVKTLWLLQNDAEAWQTIEKTLVGGKMRAEQQLKAAREEVLKELEKEAQR